MSLTWGSMHHLGAQCWALLVRLCLDFRYHVLARAHPFIFRQSTVERLAVLGSKCGAWPIPLNELNLQSVCYLAGVGEDITFDLALIEQVGCTVHAFDPTPRAIAHVQSVAATEPRFKFQAVGVWSMDQTLRFYQPAKPSHVSHSILNLQKTDVYFEAPCRSIASLMQQHGHHHIDLLKLDIEGAEYAVLQAMFDANIFPKILCVEFDQPYPYWDTVRFIRSMLPRYDIYKIMGWNFGFIRRNDGTGLANAA